MGLAWGMRASRGVGGLIERGRLAWRMRASRGVGGVATRDRMLIARGLVEWCGGGWRV